MRVLVVEDEMRMAALLKRGLEEEGYAVDVASDGQDALFRGTQIGYDAIVLDAMLPLVDGFEVCRELRSRQRWPMLIGRKATFEELLWLTKRYLAFCGKPRIPRWSTP